MSESVDVVFVAREHTVSRGDRGDGSAGEPAPPTTAVRSGGLKQTYLDAWTYCKASKAMVAGNQWVPRLSALAALLSGITGTAIFVNLQDQPSTAAKALVASVAVLTAGITAMQTWTASRIRALNNQYQGFHDLHRRILADMESDRDLAEPAYADNAEAKLKDLMAGMSDPSPRAWRTAREAVLADRSLICPWLFPPDRAPEASRDEAARGQAF